MLSAFSIHRFASRLPLIVFLGWFLPPSLAAQTPLPDLVVSDVWRDAGSGTVEFLLTNSGAGVADGAISCALSIDGSPADTVSTGQMDPGATRRLSFTVPFVLEPVGTEVLVAVDTAGSVVESREDNNDRIEIWSSDANPPSFASQPVVENLSPTEVVIRLTADEPVDGIVHLATTARMPAIDIPFGPLQQEHEIPVGGLVPDTLYEYLIEVTDAGGNSSTAPRGFFRTMMESPDTVPPVLGLANQEPWAGRVSFDVETADETLDRIEVYVGDELVLIDHSSPYVIDLDSAEYDNGGTTLRVEAVDRGGNRTTDTVPVTVANLVDATIPTAELYYTFDPEAVAGNYSFEVRGIDDTGIRRISYYLDGVTRGTRVFGPGEQGTNLLALFNWNTTKEQNGDAFLVGEVEDINGKLGYAQLNITIDNPPPPDYTWALTRHNVAWESLGDDNFVRITLELLNAGNRPLSFLESFEYGLQGFQIFNSSVVSSAGRFDTEERTWHVEGGCRYELLQGFQIDSLNPGDTLTITLEAVPLLSAPVSVPPAFGSPARLRIRESYWNSPIHEEVFAAQTMVAGSMTPAALHAVMCADSDYLILTCPGRLFNTYGGGYAFGEALENHPAYQLGNLKVEELLRKSAELARWRNGVLGYVAPELATDNKLITPLLAKSPGTWSKQLAPGYTSGGYLLLVGEPDIVPASAFGVPNYFKSQPGSTLHCWPSDILYANTVGDYIVPELNVGRIIGDSPDLLTKHVQNSLDIDPGTAGISPAASSIYLLAGEGTLEGAFRSTITGLRDRLEAIYPLATVQADFLADVVETSERAVFDASAPGSGLIAYSGHGWMDAWDDILPVAFPGGYFGANRPLMIGHTCLSGSYYPNPWLDNFGGNGFADALTSRGAAVVAGAIQVTSIQVGNQALDTLFHEFLNDPRGIGHALQTTKVSLYPDSLSAQTNATREEWIVSQNLYGDPKLGAHVRNAIGARRSSARAETSCFSSRGVETVEVVVPDPVEKETEDGITLAVPGHPDLLETGKPRTATYTETFPLEEGTTVRAVQLIDASPTDVRDLPLAIARYVGATYEEPLAYDGGTGPAPEVWPGRAFSWNVARGINGANELQLTVYPCQMNHLEGTLSWTSSFLFEVETTPVDVAIQSLSVGTPASGQESTLPVSLEYSWNGATTAPLIASVYLVTRVGGETVTGGAVSRELYQPTPRGTILFNLEPGATPAGTYGVAAELTGPDGNIVAKEWAPAEVAAGLLRPVSIAAVPRTPSPGQLVSFTTELTNSGYAGTEGTLLVRVRDEEAILVNERQLEVPFLDAGASRVQEWQFEIPADAGPIYDVRVSVLSDGRESEPTSITLFVIPGTAWLVH